MANVKKQANQVALQDATAKADAVMKRLASVEQSFAESDKRATAKAIQLISQGGQFRGRITMGPVEIDIVNNAVAVNVNQTEDGE
jgi:hypothetical protein